MKNGLLNKRIPTIFALLILIGAIAVSTFLVRQGIFYEGKATTHNEPQNVIISNITNTSFTVSFSTAGKTSATLILPEANNTNSIILDDRDKKSGTKNLFFSHFITIPNLKPNTTYPFKLIIDDKEFSNNSFMGQTGPDLNIRPPSQNPIFGKVILTDGSFGTDSIVTAKTPGSQVITAITDEQGQYIIPTNSLRKQDFSTYTVLSKNAPFTVNVFHNTQRSTIETIYSNAQNLPAITLLEKYSFINQGEDIKVEESKLNFSLPSSNAKVISILRPREGEALIDQKPSFSGTAYPNTKIVISIGNVIRKELLVSSLGSWSFRPTASLPQGSHTFTLFATDKTGTSIRLNRKFSIFPLGSQIAQSATPSATPQILPTIQLSTTPPTSITPITTIFPTATPIAAISPTSIPVATVSTVPSIAKPGTFGNTIALTSVSIILIVLGTALLFAL